MYNNFVITNHFWVLPHQGTNAKEPICLDVSGSGLLWGIEKYHISTMTTKF